MSRSAAIVIALLLLLLPAVAWAAKGNNASVQSEVSKNGGVRYARNLSIGIEMSKPGASHLVVTKRIVLHVDRKLALNRRIFPICSMKLLKAGKYQDCPSGSRLGSGGISVDARPIFDQPIPASAIVFNSRVGTKPALVIYIPGALQKFVIPGILSRDKAPYGWKADFRLARVPIVTGQPDGALKTMAVQIGAITYKGTSPIPLLTGPIRCNGGYLIKTDFYFADRSRRSSKSRSRC